MYRIGLLFTLETLVPLLKAERTVSDSFLKRYGASLNTFIGSEIPTEPLIGKFNDTTAEFRCDLDHTGAV